MQQSYLATGKRPVAPLTAVICMRPTNFMVLHAITKPCRPGRRESCHSPLLLVSEPGSSIGYNSSDRTALNWVAQIQRSFCFNKPPCAELMARLQKCIHSDANFIRRRTWCRIPCLPRGFNAHSYILSRVSGLGKREASVAPRTCTERGASYEFKGVLGDGVSAPFLAWFPGCMV